LAIIIIIFLRLFISIIKINQKLHWHEFTFKPN
jgi:hypothetical protein